MGFSLLNFYYTSYIDNFCAAILDRNIKYLESLFSPVFLKFKKNHQKNSDICENV
jgi:hypothetical protein